MNEENATKAVARQFIDAWNAHDMQALGSLFTDDAEFVNVYGAWWTGRSKIESEHAAVHLSVFRKSQLVETELRVRFLAAEVASLHLRWTLVGIVAPNGTSLADRAGVLVFILVKGANAWRIAVAQNTDTVPRPS